MKNENKRPTKKALVKLLEEKGVDKAIVASLQRANIDTLQWVISKISEICLKCKRLYYSTLEATGLAPR